VSELKGRIQTAHQGTKDKLLANKFRSKGCYDKRTDMMKIEVGDKVLLFDEIVRQVRSRKLSSQWIGPSEVMELNKVGVTPRKGRKLIKLHVNRLKPSIEVEGDFSGERITTSVFVTDGNTPIFLVLWTLLKVT
jgi:hypothetical protein